MRLGLDHRFAEQRARRPRGFGPRELAQEEKLQQGQPADIGLEKEVARRKEPVDIGLEREVARRKELADIGVVPKEE